MVLMPTGDNVIIKTAKDENQGKTASGIILASKNTQERPDKGEVVAVGTGRILNNGDRLQPSVEVGDEVIFNKFAGTEIEVDEDKYLIIKEADILAVITK